MGFFLKNPGIHEKMDGFGVMLRGYPTISFNVFRVRKALAGAIVILSPSKPYGQDTPFDNQLWHCFQIL